MYVDDRELVIQVKLDIGNTILHQWVDESKGLRGNVETWRTVEIQILEEIDFETSIPIAFHGRGIEVSDWCALCRVDKNSEVQRLEVIDLIV